MTKVHLAVLFLLALVAIAGTGFFAGLNYCQAKHAKAQVKVLHGDAKQSLKLEADNVARKEKTDASVRVIHQTVSDCGNRPVPAAIADRLR